MSEGKGKWTVKSAMAMFSRNGGTVKNGVLVHKNPGIKMWGAIDFLVKKTSYRFSKYG